MNSKIESAFNEQLNAELFSSYLYLSMAAYFESQNLKGMAGWMRMQAIEEHMHGMKFFDFINERSGRVALLETKAPPKEWESPLVAFEDAYEHECLVSGRINDLVNLSLDEKDHASNNFLQWFVSEQVEEEASVDEVAQKLKIIGGDGGGLFMLDQELGQRVFTPPAAE